MTHIINWMGGWPREGLISVSEWEERLAAAADRNRASESFDSASSKRIRRLQEIMVEGLLKRKLRRGEGSLVVARGADIFLQSLAQRSLAEGDVVLVDRLTSRSALLIFRKAGVRICAVSGDGQGMDPEALRDAITRFHPRLLYTAPACSDPEGRVWPQERTQAITGICRDSGVLMLRDDRQESLVYDDQYGAALTEPGVLSLGQLPPGLIAGVKFGWAAGHAEDLKRWFPDASDTVLPGNPAISPLEYQALADLLEEQPLAEQMEMLRVRCRARMRQMAGLLAQQPVTDLHWRLPDGGMHIWLTLPEGLEGEALLRAAWLKGLMFQPGTPFHAADPRANTIRLTFADTDERRMQLGSQRLFHAIQEFLGRSV